MNKTLATSNEFSINPRKEPVRYDFIDALRGMAALAVLYLHMADILLRYGHVSNFLEIIIFKTTTQFFDLGKIGVIVFFAISGFVIPLSLRKRENTVSKFLISRFFRLYPAYWLSIGLALYFLFYLQAIPIPVRTAVINVTMLQQFFGVPNVIDAYWTLQIELVFYITCLVLFLYGILNQPNKIFVVSTSFLSIAVIFAILRFATHLKMPVALPLGLSVMFWGSLMQTWRMELNDEAKRYANLLAIILVLLVPPISLLAYNFDAGFDESWYRYTTSYYAALGLFYLLTGRLRLSVSFLSWLGTISYSIYLFHPIFIVITMNYFYNRYPSFPMSHLYIAIAAIMTIAFSSLVYVCVEAPCIRLGRQLNSYRTSQFTPLSQT
jgi:peptidoglycan/LPS O-acetylase OafA/YrhL